MNKKIIILGIATIMGVVVAQDIVKEPSEDMLKIYNSLVNHNWNGFDGNGAKVPDAKLIWRGFVDFPYYDHNKKIISKEIEIYKYQPVINMNYLLPIDKMDFKSTPEIAYLSFSSDYRSCTKEDWEELKKYVEVEKKKPSISMNYKICFKFDDGEAVAILNSDERPFIMYKSKEGEEWEFAKTISREDNFLFSVISNCLEVSGLTGSHEERLSKKIKEIIENKIVLTGVFPEEPTEGTKKEKRQPRPILEEIEPEEIKPQNGGLVIELENRAGGESQPPAKIIMLPSSE